MMTIFESMAYTLINEHGRSLFLQTGYGNPHGFQSRFFRWALIAYGREFYELPERMGLPHRKHNMAWVFPIFTLAQSMRAGIAPTEAMSYPSMSEYSSRHTPLHLGTALAKYGREFNAREIDRLLSVDFLKKTYSANAAKTPESFSSHTYINPYTPEDIGRRPFDVELLPRHQNQFQVLDELGNAAWFPREYLTEVLSRTGSVYWYSVLCRLEATHGRWKDLVQGGATNLLRQNLHKDDGRRVDYRNVTNYLRNARSGDARDYMRRISGVRTVLNVVRSDASPQEMVAGLRTLANSKSEKTEALYSYLGRPLSIEDFRRLTSRQALQVLYYAPYAAVKEVIDTHREELAAMFFSLMASETLTLVTDCMTDHKNRTTSWTPDVGIDLGNSSFAQKSVQEEWEGYMKPLVEDYDRAKAWRDEFLQHAPPEVLFLALMRWAGRQDTDPLADVAIENVLRSYPTITEVQNVLRTIPEAITKLSTL